MPVDELDQSEATKPPRGVTSQSQLTGTLHFKGLRKFSRLKHNVLRQTASLEALRH